MAMTDGLLTPGVRGNAFYWEIDFNEAFGISANHFYSFICNILFETKRRLEE
jgi:hypothetical protein